MPINSLRDLYIAELRDLYDAERQLLQELPRIAEQVKSSTLARLLNQHVNETHLHIERLELLFHQVGEATEGRGCEGVRGLLEEARRRSSEAQPGDVLDAALVGALQRIAHYEIAAYGCARAYAETIGDHSAARVLQQTLDEEGALDHRLTRIAEDRVNEAAEDDAAAESLRQSRLRYMAAEELPEFRYFGYQVVNRHDVELGKLDGFIVESPSGRPLYFVVDSGGWFIGRRYVIPVGQLDVDQAARVLWTDLDKETIGRYPAFSPSAFLAMNDEEAIRYEHKLLKVAVPGRPSAHRPPRYEELPAYRPPTWLMTGVWMTETSGFASVPPRAQSDLRPPTVPASAPERDAQANHEVERGESERQPSPEPPAPHLEQYKER